MSGATPGFGLALRLARRELRHGLQGFVIFLACLVLGVAAIAGVGSLSAAVGEGLSRDGQALLGGDMEFRLTQRAANAEELAWLQARGAVAETFQMRAMAKGDPSGKRTLVELKAVDDLYPLYGRIELAPEGALATAFGPSDGLPGAVVERQLLGRLGVAVGDRLVIGDATFRIAAAIAREPDKGTEAFALGPRVMIAKGALAATGLVQPGTIMQVAYRLKLAQGVDPGAIAAAAKADLPDAGWRIRDRANGAPGVRQFVDRMTMFLTLTGLTALVVGGVGVGNAVRGHLSAKTETIATLKCLGAPGGLVFQVYLLQVLALAGLGIVLGLMLGLVVPPVLAWALADTLPVPAIVGIYPGPLALAAAFGLLVALAFAVWPLARAREVPAAGLFRHLVAPARRWPRPAYVVLTGLALAALVALAIATAEDRRLAAWFVAGAAGAFVALRLTAHGVIATVRRLPRPRRPGLRLALANLHRPGAETPAVVLSLGLGLTLLVVIALVQGNLSRQVEQRLPAQAPAFFVVDVQPDQLADLQATVAAVPGAGEVQMVPSLRGRIARVKGMDAEKWPIAPEGRWALRGDRGLTYAATQPKGSTVEAGEWWPADYRGPPLISFDAEVAKAMGIGVGDTLTLNVLGREIEARIANLRRIDWTTLGINFTIVFAPGTLEAAPHTFLGTIHARDPKAEAAIFDAVTERFPNISVIAMKEALATVDQILGNIAMAIGATASVTLLAGVLVLAGAMAAGHRHRVYDAVVLKVLGATRADVLKAYLIEYALLGLAAAVVAALIGGFAAWILVTRVMEAEWAMMPGRLGLTVLGSMALTVLLGLAGTWRALGRRAAPVLREA
jgi:putative ABC transport system permease protein